MLMHANEVEHVMHVESSQEKMFALILGLRSLLWQVSDLRVNLIKAAHNNYAYFGKNFFKSYCLRYADEVKEN